MTNLLDFTGKQILITGAASGIGKETAVLLSNLGAKIIMTDMDEDGLNAVFSLLEGQGHHYMRFDVGDLLKIEGHIREIVHQFGPLDGFVHCVGIRSRRPLSMITPEVLNEVMNLNFGSFIEYIRCISRKNHYHEGLSIVGISSVSSKTGAVSVTAYAASKAAMESAVRCLAKELAPKNIRLNTVVPAQVNTPAYKKLLEMTGNAEDKTLARQFLGLCEPIDVANTIALLLSGRSRFITGTSIPVDGGFLSS